MNEAVMKQHIDLYVNNYSIDLGVNGKAAVEKLVEVF
jgi:1,4-dihydroxy-6-naphthoate synthase